MSTYVWGVKIFMADHMSPVAETTDIGLYNVNSKLTGAANASQAVVPVTDATKFSAYTSVLIKEGATLEECFILSIASNNITMRSNLANSYTSAAYLYADSEIRWMQNQVSGVTTWNYSMITSGGIDKIVKSIDLQNGGNFANVNGFSVTVQNTDLLWKTLQTDLDISIIGKLAQAVLFTDSTASTQGTFICKSTSWDRGTYTVQMRGAWTRRDANILTEQNVDTTPSYGSADKEERVTIPSTYGKWQSSYAQLNRSVNVNKEWEWQNLIAYIAAEGSPVIGNYGGDVATRKAWPIVAKVDSLNYTIQLSESTVDNLLALDSIYIESMSDIAPDNLYVYITTDDNAQGTYRKITNIALTSTNKLVLTVSDYYETDPTESATGSEAWISIIEIRRQFDFDTWPCKGIVDENGTLINDAPQIYVYDKSDTVSVSGDEETVNVQKRDADYVLIPPYGYKIATGDTDYNDVVIQPLVFNGNIDVISSYLILPIDSNNFNFSADSTLSKWKIAADGYATDLSLYTKIVDGCYYYPPSGVYSATTSITDKSNMSDKNADNKAVFSATFTAIPTHVPGGQGPILAFTFTLPSSKKGFSFDNFYLGIDMHCLIGGADWNNGIVIRHRKFLGEPANIIYGDAMAKAKNLYIRDMPDFYYTTISSLTKNQWFYQSTLPTGSATVNGYKNFLISTFRDSDKVKEFLILIYCDQDNFVFFPATVTVNLTQIVAIYQRDSNIDNIVYSSAFGRIYNSTWGRSITETDLIYRSNNLYEHFCRLQNWSERDKMPSGGWGRAYSDNALIKLTGEGSLIDSTVNDSYYPTRQFTDTGDSKISDIKKSLCREFFFAGYVDNSGYECLRKIPTTEGQLTAPTELITLADIRLADSKITIEEPDPTRIYPEPFVRFNKNMATGNYKSVVAVHNVTATSTTGAANYTGTTAGGWVESPDGMYSDSEKQELWNKCVSLYQLCQVINTPPSDMTDMEWANGGDHALPIAKQYIDNWVNWMRLKKCSFKVHFLTTAGGATAVRNWTEGQRFNLQLVHETNNVVVECILDRIAIDTNAPYHIEVSAYMLEADKLQPDYYIQDTTDESNPQWIDTTTTYSNDYDKIDQM